MRARSSQFRDFRFFFLISLAAGTTCAIRAGSQPVLLGSVATASPAQTVGISGSTAYTCDNNEISVINIANPAAPVLSGTVTPPGTGTNTYCDVQRGTLVQMIDGNPPAFVTYDITNPASPNRTASTPVNKKFFGPPYFLGNQAFFGTNEIVFGSGYPGPINHRRGLLAGKAVRPFRAGQDQWAEPSAGFRLVDAGADPDRRERAGNFRNRRREAGRARGR